MLGLIWIEEEYNNIHNLTDPKFSGYLRKERRYLFKRLSVKNIKKNSRAHENDDLDKNHFKFSLTGVSICVEFLICNHYAYVSQR